MSIIVIEAINGTDVVGDSEVLRVNACALETS